MADSEWPKILIVDDNANNIQVIGSILRDAEYSIGFAVNGRQALELLHDNADFDLVLLDVNMPELNGIETCRAMRRDHRLRNLPVIFLTALNDTDDIVAGFDVGAQDYVTKPFNGRELLSRVKTHIELKRNRDLLKTMNDHLDELVKVRTHELRVAVEELRTANEKLQLLDEAKVEFLRIISHEINTPLNGIIGFTSILKDMMPSEEVASMLENLELSAQRLERFTKVSLLITELRTKETSIEYDHVRVDGLIRQVMERLSKKITAYRQVVTIEGDVRGTVLNAGEYLVDICLENLLDNAIKYSPEAAPITIRVDAIPGEITISVIDQGSGFSAEALRKLFTLFAPGERHVDKNMGLGLALVKLIMDAHGGSVVVVNNAIAGATVTLRFPQS